jgi:hypothetical protein
MAGPAVTYRDGNDSASFLTSMSVTGVNAPNDKHIVFFMNDNSSQPIWTGPPGWVQVAQAGDTATDCFIVMWTKDGNTETGDLTFTSSVSRYTCIQYYTVAGVGGASGFPPVLDLQTIAEVTFRTVLTFDVTSSDSVLCAACTDGTDLGPLSGGNLDDEVNLWSPLISQSSGTASVSGLKESAVGNVDYWFTANANRSDGMAMIGASFALGTFIPSGPSFTRDGVPGNEIGDVDGITADEIGDVDGVPAAAFEEEYRIAA